MNTPGDIRKTVPASCARAVEQTRASSVRVVGRNP